VFSDRILCSGMGGWEEGTLGGLADEVQAITGTKERPCAKEGKKKDLEESRNVPQRLKPRSKRSSSGTAFRVCVRTRYFLWDGPLALGISRGQIPGATPQAGIYRALGAEDFVRSHTESEAVPLSKNRAKYLGLGPRLVYIAPLALKILFVLTQTSFSHRL
jgi:hypothetical protein